MAGAVAAAAAAKRPCHVYFVDEERGVPDQRVVQRKERLHSVAAVQPAGVVHRVPPDSDQWRVVAIVFIVDAKRPKRHIAHRVAEAKTWAFGTFVAGWPEAVHGSSAG